MPRAPLLRSMALWSPLWFLPLVFLNPVDVFAQVSARPHGQLFAIAGPGRFDSDGSWYAGGGFEHVRGNGFGVGVEAGWAWGFQEGQSNRTELVSVYATGQQSDANARVQPFALAGVGFVSRAVSDTTLVYVLGAGTNIWFRPGKGVRLDLRVPLGLANTGGVVLAAGITIR